MAAKEPDDNIAIMLLSGKKAYAAAIILIGAISNFSATAVQYGVTIAWSPSPSSGVTAYDLYYGTASKSYSSMLSFGVTNATVTNLTGGMTYYFAVTAYDATTGQESAYSSEASYTAGASQPTLKLTLSAGRAVLNCTGLPGTNYNILASKNLASWSVIGTVAAGTNGTFQFTDPVFATNRVYAYKTKQH